MSDSNSNNNSKNDGVRNHINDLRNEVERLRQLFKNISDGKKQDENPQNSGMAFFSLDPQDTQFVSGTPTEFPGEAKENTNPFGNHMGKKNLSPDLAEFFLTAGLLLHDALYMPFANRRGRLTDFFSWVEKASDRMGAADFNNDEREQFADWCRSVGKTLVEAQNKHGLWLTDDEEDLVLAMTNGDLWNDSEDGSENGGFSDL